MGNCLKRSTADDISLLRGSESGGRESTDQLEPAPLYSVRETFPAFTNALQNKRNDNQLNFLWFFLKKTIS